MQKTTKLKLPKPRRTATASAATTPQKSDPNWKPQPCGLSREELRRIVEEILG